MFRERLGILLPFRRRGLLESPPPVIFEGYIPLLPFFVSCLLSFSLFAFHLLQKLGESVQLFSLPHTVSCSFFFFNSALSLSLSSRPDCCLCWRSVLPSTAFSPSFDCILLVERVGYVVTIRARSRLLLCCARIALSLSSFSHLFAHYFLQVLFAGIYLLLPFSLFFLCMEFGALLAAFPVKVLFSGQFLA